MRPGLPPLDAFSHCVNLWPDWSQTCLVHLSHVPIIHVALAVAPARALIFTGHPEQSGTNGIIRYCLLITRWSVSNCPSVFCSSLCKLCSRVSLTAQLTASSYLRYFGCIALLIQSSFVGANLLEQIVGANWGPHHQKDTLLQSVLI